MTGIAEKNWNTDCGFKFCINFEFPEFSNFTKVANLVQDIYNIFWSGSKKIKVLRGERENRV
jgi:hypothetical protein